MTCGSDSGSRTEEILRSLTNVATISGEGRWAEEGLGSRVYVTPTAGSEVAPASRERKKRERMRDMVWILVVKFVSVVVCGYGLRQYVVSFSWRWVLERFLSSLVVAREY